MGTHSKTLGCRILQSSVLYSIILYTSLLVLQNLMAWSNTVHIFWVITSYNPSLHQSYKSKSKNLISNLLRIASHLRFGIPKANALNFVFGGSWSVYSIWKSKNMCLKARKKLNSKQKCISTQQTRATKILFPDIYARGEIHKGKTQSLSANLKHFSRDRSVANIADRVVYSLSHPYASNEQVQE